VATTAEAVRNQLETTIKAITPTKHAAMKFALADRDDSVVDTAQPSGSERRFFVRLGGGQETPPHHPAESATVETFIVGVLYPWDWDQRAQDVLMRSDVHDLKVALNNPSNFASNVIHQWVERWSRPVLLGTTTDPEGWQQEVQVVVQYWEANS